MTVDVEDYFQVQAFTDCISRASWDSIPRRVESNVDRILGLFERTGVKATFFTLGWIAERHPRMIRNIVAAGHELASHGWDHTRADAQDDIAFFTDVSRTRQTLEQIGGTSVIGYRAATFSIGTQNMWAFEGLLQAGYRYSSSINPIKHDLYGMPNAPRSPFKPRGLPIWELPMTTIRAFGRNWPWSGGGYFRLFHAAVYRKGLKYLNDVQHTPGIFYFHPWEVDPDQPRIADCRLKARIRHYTNLSTMASNIERILCEFAWGRMDDVYQNLLDQSGPIPRSKSWAG